MQALCLVSNEEEEERRIVRIFYKEQKRTIKGTSSST